MLQDAKKQYSEAAIAPVNSEILFADYIEKVWLPSKHRLEQITLAEYKHEVGNIAAYFRKKRATLGGMNIRVIEEYYDVLRITLSECSIQKYHTKIHSALKQAARKELIPNNPAANVERPKPTAYNASFYNTEEMGQVLKAVKGTKLELPVILGFYGLRRSEVVGLRWDAVDFTNDSITIKHTVTQYTENGKRKIEAKAKTKNKSSRRTLPMIPALRNKLLAVLAERDEWRKLCGRSYCTENLDYVCVDEMGELIKPDYITYTFDKVLAKNGLRKIRFHDLRHSCASLLLANGVSMKEIQDWLGHSTFKTTADIYTHLTFNSKLSSANALNLGTAFGLMTGA